ncbi:GLUG motif-containing protein [Methylosinus sp. Ce-a6]|uniref:beta strand repeat-containing protein n=1 Tax=Methylosinus sp. Ce-a6 TaxID=2172005 RepID=UPI001FCEE22F|nr:GLUG motif-containing protein [Methylosinus sp. Ce-a6]
MTAVAALMAPPRALANPTGGVVVDGAATIASTGSVTNVTQSTNRAIINWLTFSIGVGETVNFSQPSALAVTLNRVVGNEQSVIAGALNANGRVFLVNSAGILFTKDAQVNVGGLVASTLDISNSNFMAGNYTFSGSSSAAVVNRGTIYAADGGYVALLDRTVSNEGTINAKLGTIALASGDQITLNFGGDSLLDVTIDKGAYDALVENKGLIKADGGQVTMTARAADAVLSAQVNNSGLIQARTIADLTGGSSSTGSVKIGKIKMLASGGTTKVSGKLDASAPNGGKGGAIETSGNKVTIADSAEVTTASSTSETGAWTIDPDGFTIGIGGDITGTLLGSLLASNNIVLWSTSGGGTHGNIYVDSAVTWSGNTILTLNATNNIYVNAPITATGTSAGLVLNYGSYASTGGARSGTNYYVDIDNGAKVTLSGTSASLKINGNSYALFRGMTDLAAYASVTATGYYALAQDIDASGKTYSRAVIGTLSGTLAGLGHTIGNLTINDTTATGFAALIGTLGSSSATSATVRDIGLVNANIYMSSGYAATLIGLSWGTVSNAYATGTVSGASPVGGLVARNQFGFVTDSWAAVNVSGWNNVGGLVGWNVANSATNGVISNSYATGTVTARAGTANLVRNIFGGLVGMNSGGTINNSYATGDVTFGASGATAGTNAAGVAVDGSALGGLVGENTVNGRYVGTIIDSYATGDVSGPGNYLGGLVGYNYGGKVDGSYATGDVTGNATNSSQNIGGLVGGNLVYSSTLAASGSGSITNSSASGNVYGYTQVGGLVGVNFGTITGSSATGNATGQFTVGGLAGATSGTISNSSASGNVTATNLGVAGTYGGNAGGLAGTNSGAITGSTASGNVTGTTNVGGLVGGNGGAVNNSTATGDVFGATNTGGLIGSNYSFQLGVGTVTNSSATGSVNAGGGSLIGSNTSTGAVTNSTYRDARAEARAAAAQRAQAQQTRQAALSAGNVVASAAEASSKRPLNAQASTSAGKAAVSAAAGANIDDNVQGETPAQTSPPAQRPRVRHASTTSAGGSGQKAHVSSPSAGYRARIRSIDVDGRHFDLGGGGKTNAPDQKAR